MSDAIRAAATIERFLQDETVQGAFAAVRDDYRRQWEAALSPAEREEMWRRQRALADVEHQLRVVVERGVVANVKLQREQRTAAFQRVST